MRLRRARGLILRLVRRRVPAVLVGSILVAAAVWMETSRRFDVWWLEGIALIAGATGAAILYTGLTGAVPDWTNPEE
jgi:hypothetical protein